MKSKTPRCMAVAPFAIALSEKYRPSQIADFIGLHAVKEILAGFAAYPFVPCGWLFYGPTGLGKTSMAIALANAIAAQFHFIAARLCTLESVERLCCEFLYVPRRSEDCTQARFHLCLVDECDAMSSAAQILFLSKLETTSAPPQTIFVFTTNSIERLDKRFVSRCRPLAFVPHEIGPELTKLLAEIWAKEAPEQMPPPDFGQIVRLVQGDIRAAINALEVLMLPKKRKQL